MMCSSQTFADKVPDSSAITTLKDNPMVKPAPEVVYDIYRLKATPAGQSTPALNPPTLHWPTASQAYFTVELSMDKTFQSEIITSDKIKWCFFNPHKTLDNGVWYWRYKTHNKDSSVSLSKTYVFKITDKVRTFEYPSVETLIDNIPRQRPYMLTYGTPLQKVIANAAKLPQLRQGVIQIAEQTLRKEILDIPNFDSSKLTMRQFKKVKMDELKRLKNLVQTYLISGSEKYKKIAIKRLQNIMTWKVKDGMMMSRMIRVIAATYDSFHDSLTPALKLKIISKVKPYLEQHYNKWAGSVENRQIQNHFWQMELSAFFETALATVQDYPEHKKYLAYGYGVFMARSPVVGGNDGGWANGHGYFSVNNSTVVDMAYMLQKITGVDVYGKPWYQAMADYFIHTAPAGGPIDGFGDMHDRGNNNGRGGKNCLYIGLEENDQKALWHAAQIAKKNGGIDSWLQLVNGADFNPDEIDEPTNISQAKAFKEVGLVAMHTKVTKPQDDLALYFRSSPYGGNGHMHANQNCFNISYKGKRVFYSTGYYTSFADPHSITSYKHTRASNGILINGKGQAYGHEGYGWIKRYLHGEQISYTCGDASMAYRGMVNDQWSFLAKKYMTQKGKMPQDNFGDAKLKRFDRHVAFLRPNIFVIYDVLEADQENEWSLLLHTYKELNFPQNYFSALCRACENFTEDVFSGLFDGTRAKLIKIGGLGHQFFLDLGANIGK